MEKKSKRKFVAPEVLSVSAGPDGTPLHADCNSNGSNDFIGCNANGISAEGSCISSGNGAIGDCASEGLAF